MQAQQGKYILIIGKNWAYQELGYLQIPGLNMVSDTQITLTFWVEAP